MNLNVHFHLVVPDSVFVEDGEGLRFEMLPVPTNANVLAIAEVLRARRQQMVAAQHPGLVEGWVFPTGKGAEDEKRDAVARVFAIVKGDERWFRGCWQPRSDPRDRERA